MYLQPKSWLSRLLGAAWTIFLICLLLWLAIWLLEKVWVWIMVIGTMTVVLWVGLRVWHLRRERW